MVTHNPDNLYAAVSTLIVVAYLVYFLLLR